jgi:hypothetical protein
LTPAGRHFLEKAKSLLHQSKLAFESTSSLHSGINLPLRFGYSPFVNHQLVEKTVSEYRDLVPGGQIEPSSECSASLLNMVAEGHLDAALVNMPLGEHKLFAQRISSQHISELLQRFTVYCAEELSKKSIDIHTMRVYGIFALVVPFMRFSRSSTRPAALAITEQFEGIIDEVQKAVLQDSHGMHLRIEFKNMLVFSYMLVCHAITIGLSATVLSYHLYLFRAISVADWTGLPARLRLQYTILCLHLMLCFYAFDAPFESKFGIGAKTLTDLRMLLESATTDSDREHMSVHQCVFRWFLDKLDADMEWGGRVSTSRQTLPLLTAGEQDLIVELTRRFSHYRYPITTSHIAEFVGQFGTTQRIKAVLRMLSSVRLYPLWEISEAIERLLAAELDQFGGIVIAPLGDLTGSTSILAYMAAHSRLKNIVFAENVEKALEMTSRGGRVYFIDDCVISATQSLSIIGDLTGMRKLKQHHTRYCQPLSEFYKTEFMNRKVIFVYCIATDFALEIVDHPRRCFSARPARFPVDFLS